MRCVSIAICTSGEPVSVSLRPCLLMISCLASLVRAIEPPGRRLPGLRPRRQGNAPSSRDRVGPKGSGNRMVIRSRAPKRVESARDCDAVPVGSLRKIVREARARTGVPGVAAGVLRDGVVETCADGVLRLGSDVAVQPETPFRIASISKPFTASLALSCLPLDEP